VFLRAGFGTCPLGLITVWSPVRVLSAPPRSPTLTEISRGWVTPSQAKARKEIRLEKLIGRLQRFEHPR
jgi:hypothetical protein